MEKMIDLRVVKAGGARWAAEVNLAAFPLTRLYRQSTAEAAASIKRKKEVSIKTQLQENIKAIFQRHPVGPGPVTLR